MKASIISVLFLLIMASSSLASQIVVSCEAFATAGFHKSMNYKTYSKIYPTIIINEDSETITYVYTQHNRKWQTDYKIAYKNENRLLGFSKLNATTVKFIHYDITTGNFNIVFSGGDFAEFSNTLTTGRCFK
jgi:hypothetical protein